MKNKFSFFPFFVFIQKGNFLFKNVFWIGRNINKKLFFVAIKFIIKLSYTDLPPPPPPSLFIYKMGKIKLKLKLKEEERKKGNHVTKSLNIK